MSVSLFQKAELARGEEETDKCRYRAQPVKNPVHAKSQLGEFGPRGEKVGINAVYLSWFNQSQGTGWHTMLGEVMVAYLAEGGRRCPQKLRRGTLLIKKSAPRMAWFRSAVIKTLVSICFQI